MAPFTFADQVDQISLVRRAEIRDIASNRGLAITGLHWLLVKPDGLQIASSDERVRLRCLWQCYAVVKAGEPR